MSGNVFLKGARPSAHETDFLLRPEIDPGLNLVEKADGCYLELSLDKGWSGEQSRRLVTTELLGKASIPDVPYEQRDGAPVRVNIDYFGKERNEANPTPGSFENPGSGSLTLKVR